MDGLSEPPRHVVVVSRFAVEGYLLINQPDVFGGHPERARGAPLPWMALSMPRLMLQLPRPVFESPSEGIVGWP